jgi:hypothetical protein
MSSSISPLYDTSQMQYWPPELAKKAFQLRFRTVNGDYGSITHHSLPLYGSACRSDPNSETAHVAGSIALPEVMILGSECRLLQRNQGKGNDMNLIKSLLEKSREP